MGYNFKWKPSKAAKEEFVDKMNEIDKFCRDHNIKSSLSNDSYYFEVKGKSYRVSNHTIAASDAGAFDDNGERWRESYHDDRDEIICFTASKTRIIEIYNNLLAGKELDKRGNIKK